MTVVSGAGPEFCTATLPCFAPFSGEPVTGACARPSARTSPVSSGRWCGGGGLFREFHSGFQSLSPTYI